VVLHSEIEQEAGRWNVEDVARGICDKLVRRHPHVFGESAVDSTAGVLAQWDQIKRAEKGHEEQPYLHGTGKGLPGLLRAAKLQKKAAKVGFDWPDAAGVLAKIREELAELEAALAGTGTAAADEELGDLMFSVVNLIRFRKLDPEVLMEAANAKFEQRFHAMDCLLREQGKSLHAATPVEMEQAWQAAKLDHGEAGHPVHPRRPR
jgi:MazG family protein